MFKYLKNEKSRIFLVTILNIVLVLLSIFPFDFLGKILNNISKNQINVNEIIKNAIILIIVAISYYLLSSIMDLIIFQKYIDKIYTFQKELLKDVLTKRPEFFDKLSIGEIMGRLVADIEYYVAPLYSWGVFCYGQGIVANIVIAIYIFSKIDYKFMLLINIPYIVSLIILIKRKKSYGNKYKELNEKYDEISKITLESIKGIKIIRAFNLQSKRKEKFLQSIKEYSKFNLSYSILSEYNEIQTILAETIAYLILIIYGYYMYSISKIDIGSLLSVTLVMQLMYWPYLVINYLIITIIEFKEGIKRIEEILEDKSCNEINNSTINLDFQNEISFENLSFSYKDNLVLDNISFKIKKGETIGIIGKTASGKTTLVKLLLRLYEFNKGDILIDGKSIKEYNIKSYRDNFSYAAQEYFIFSKTIKENILFYSNLENDLEKILEISDLKKDILKFEKGIDTLVGEDGMSLSGGQKQRVSIARALIRDPKILILDDSLSALDVETESNIIKNLEEYRKGKTNIIISHRLTSVKNADKIIILNDRKIESIGTHEELLKTSMWYKNLFYYQMKKGDMNEK